MSRSGARAVDPLPVDPLGPEPPALGPTERARYITAAGRKLESITRAARGETYASIASDLGISTQRVGKIVREYLVRVAREQAAPEDVELAVARELTIITDRMTVLAPLADEGSIDANKEIRALSEYRARLLGLFAPEVQMRFSQVNVRVDKRTTIDDARARAQVMRGQHVRALSPPSADADRDTAGPGPGAGPDRNGRSVAGGPGAGDADA